MNLLPYTANAAKYLGRSCFLLSALLAFSVSHAQSTSPPTNTPKVPPTHAASTLVVSRIWHGWTTKENAAKFEALLVQEVFPGIEKQLPKGYKGAQLLRRETAEEVEFTTILWFDSLEAVKRFAGEDYETAHIDPKAKLLLSRYDAKSVHQQVVYAKLADPKP